MNPRNLTGEAARARYCPEAAGQSLKAGALQARRLKREVTSRLRV
jgi:hypothetical protein